MRLDLSLSNAWIEGKSKLEVSSEYLNRRQQHIVQGETNSRKKLDTKTKGRILKWHRRVKIVRELTVFEKKSVKSGDKKLVKIGRMPTRTGRIRALEVGRRKD